MTQAARSRRDARQALQPILQDYLRCYSPLRFRCTNAQLRGAARQMAMNLVAQARRRGEVLDGTALASFAPAEA